MDARVASDVLAISGETLAGKSSSGPHDLTRTWDRPYVTTNWPSGRPLSYDYSCDRDISSVPSSLTDSLEIYNREFLYQDGPSTFDLYGTVHPMSLPLSPTANQDDPEWPMFLSTSLSTSLDPLRLPDFQPATRDLLFGPEPTTDPTSASTMSDDPASRSVPAYRDATEPLSDTIDSLPFSPSLSQTTAQTSMSRLSGSPYRNGAGQDCFLLAEANSSSAERTMSASEEYASLLGITPPSPGFGVGRASIPSFSISTSAFRPADLANVPASKAGRGLSGWSGDHGAAISAPPLGPRTSAQHKTRLNPSPVLSYSNFKVETASSTLAGREISGEAGEAERPKRRKSTLGRPLAYDLGSDEEDGGDDNDSDDYCPSRSPSVEPSFPNIASQFMTDIKPQLSPLVKAKSRRGKGKARGSAALALAVVTQLGARSREGSEVFEDLDLLLTSRDGKPGVRKRKNHPIPLPVPIPNLNKKSRGRKVPFVDCSVSSASLAGSQSSESGQGSNSPGADDSSGSGRPRRKTSRMPTPMNEDIAGSRTYVCVVAGCGKCFVRGEHLKRHVRSIHTYDKPHPCPYEGCDKTFSRRDNLGQHVRIHLQP